MATKTKSKKKSQTPIAQSLVAPLPPPARPKVVRNRIVLALDISGSMGGLERDAMRAVNSTLRTIEEETRNQGQETDVAIVMFDDRIETNTPPTPAARVGQLTYYPVRGGTALYDAVARGAEIIDDGDEDTSYLVVAFTDGHENASRRYPTEAAIQRFVTERQDRGNWSFALQVPVGMRESIARKFGIPVGNVREWEQTRKGTEDMGLANNVAVQSYMSARSTGQRKSVALYAVTADLNKLSKTKLKSELDDISHNFKELNVDKEIDVKTFVESKTRKPYVIGSAYYELTKPEVVQGGKKLLIMERGKSTVWGGDEARELIGLPTDGTPAKVTPGNLGAYRVFSQSTSVNRKLVRGTTVLFDKTLSKSLAPTWVA